MSKTQAHLRYKRNCAQCGREFITRHSEIKRDKGKFCSRECLFASRRTRRIINCSTCGKGFPRKNIKHRFCCRDCFDIAVKRGEINYSPRSPLLIKDDYRLICLNPTDFFFPMADKRGYVLEHRLVMAKHLGRCLQSWELVHHKGIRYTGIGNKSDNLLDNLELTTRAGHISGHTKGYKDGYAKGLIDGRIKQIEELREQIKLLQWQIRELTNAKDQKSSNL